MNPELAVLVGTAATLGITHTALGLDHTVPFILLGRARAWSLSKTLLVTSVCGVAHISSSVVVGLLGVSLGVALSSLQWFEETRGYWVAWALVVFGVWYALSAIVNLRHGSPHRHVHVGVDGRIHRQFHVHGHAQSHNAAHETISPARDGLGAALRRSRWIASLFVVFLLGPCEALLPLMTAPSLGANVRASLMVACVFGVATLLTMLSLVTAGWVGLKGVWLANLEPHLNWISGLAIASSGLAILVLGW